VCENHLLLNSESGGTWSGGGGGTNCSGGGSIDDGSCYRGNYGVCENHLFLNSESNGACSGGGSINDGNCCRGKGGKKKVLVRRGPETSISGPRRTHRRTDKRINIVDIYKIGTIKITKWQQVAKWKLMLIQSGNKVEINVKMEQGMICKMELWR
jgi:hypothetical protein